MATATTVPGLACPAPWRRVMTGDDAVAVAERDALGTSARVVVWPPENLGAACAAVADVVGALDRQASRFRPGTQNSAGCTVPEAACSCSAKAWPKRSG